MTTNLVRYEIDLDNLPPLTEEQKARLKALDEMPDSAIDYSDIPQLTDEQLKTAVRGRPWEIRKPEATVRVDSDVIAWFKSQGAGYQARINAILREAMQRELHHS